ncbi:muscarinic acetylcholine receptor M3-like [Paramacrobiotus metropolitanus]|uniref:muscarinic acetylcholine receptor M3-like n=1 Tax=Paramacrobiotus metropolitanus TaxID=2943436 RepID=UPI0024459B07|nr:muscarinic acetylcholine receptor M3-like [Paramacrobiotus metropolitanus]
MDFNDTDVFNLTEYNSTLFGDNYTLCDSNCTTEPPVVNVTANSTSNITVPDMAYPIEVTVYILADTIISSLWIVLANSLILGSFLTDPKLRIIQNYYIASLALSDFCMGAFVLPLGGYQFVFEGWPSNDLHMCKFWNFMDFVMSIQSSLSVCLINYDRYKMVLHPIAYRNEESPKKALVRIFCSWIFSILFYGPVTLFWDTIAGYSVLPPYQCDVEFKDEIRATIPQAVVEFGGPLTVICFCNLRLMIYIRKRRRKMMEMKRNFDNTPVTDVTTDNDDTETKAVKKVALTKEQEKQKSEMQEFRKEQRAVRSLLILVGVYFCLWFFYEMIGNFVGPICNCVPDSVYRASYWIQYHISGVNPIIYAVTIERFRYHYQIFFSYIFPCCVSHPSKQRKKRVAPAISAIATGNPHSNTAPTQPRQSQTVSS